MNNIEYLFNSFGVHILCSSGTDVSLHHNREMLHSFPLLRMSLGIIAVIEESNLTILNRLISLEDPKKCIFCVTFPFPSLGQMTLITKITAVGIFHLLLF